MQYQVTTNTNYTIHNLTHKSYQHNYQVPIAQEY